uniref:Uncharacterized protein n=1 Tax=Oryza rufipogon TaxID=4529 RepID=A0A0E0RJC5_ORYRU
MQHAHKVFDEMSRREEEWLRGEDELGGSWGLVMAAKRVWGRREMGGGVTWRQQQPPRSLATTMTDEFSGCYMAATATSKVAGDDDDRFKGMKDPLKQITKPNGKYDIGNMTVAEALSGKGSRDEQLLHWTLACIQGWGHTSIWIVEVLSDGAKLTREWKPLLAKSKLTVDNDGPRLGVGTIGLYHLCVTCVAVWWSHQFCFAARSSPVVVQVLRVEDQASGWLYARHGRLRELFKPPSKMISTISTHLDDSFVEIGRFKPSSACPQVASSNVSYMDAAVKTHKGKTI